MFSLKEIASWIGGTIEGDETVAINDAKVWSDAGSGDITFLEDPTRVAELRQIEASAVIVSHTLPTPPSGAPPLVRVDQPLLAFCTVFARIRGLERKSRAGVHPTAVVAASAVLGEDVYVGPYASIGEDAVIGAGSRIHAGVVIEERCRIGRDCELHPRVVLYPDTVLGDRVIVHAGAVIGADGFGYRPSRQGHLHVPQLGRVVIEDDVEIGANATIDRATFTETRIGRGTKIDNLVQIGHNCQIGPHNLIAAQVGIAGSTRTGAFVVMGGQAGVRDHLQIGDRVTIGAMAGVMSSIPKETTVVGIPARPEHDARRCYALFFRLPEIWKRTLEHGKRLDAMERDEKKDGPGALRQAG